MKRTKVKLGVLVLAVLAVCLGFSTSQAQDMDALWRGKWFRATVTYSGKYTNGSGVLLAYREKEVDYLKILSVDEGNKVVNLLNYIYEDGQWQEESVDWYYTGGNSLDFLCYYFVCEGEDHRYCFGFTGRVQGKMKGGIVTSATIKSLGGLEWNDYDNEAAGVTFSAKSISESKLPLGIPK